MEDNKYYTPSIQEFHVGFRFDWDNGKEWTTNVFESDHYEDILEDLPMMRVKYLDKSDIEELGWVYKTTERGAYAFAEYYNKPEQGFWMIRHFDNNNSISVYGHDSENVLGLFSEGELYLSGVSCKNYNELERLMNQLGIEV